MRLWLVEKTVEYSVNWIVTHRDFLTLPDLKGFIQTLESPPAVKQRVLESSNETEIPWLSL